ncbi:SMP-30/gluconolactonase/LRE family protein [Qipengyuania sp. JC766]|uniref:SMP-30/gluconolactonase/LRE family protein n=1 Tax=Qipengyuania sp. JC766 TaxID=3232139 RepID=UPI0034588F09
MEIDVPVERVLDAESKLGEGVLWDSERGVVWFVDIKRKRLWHFDPDTGSNSHTDAPEQIGWAIPAENGLLLCGLKDGLYTFDPESREFAKHADVPGEPRSNRLNDACTDPWGRVWFGTMDDTETTGTGRFYVYDRGEIRAAGPAGITITNGPAVNMAGDRIYFTDTGSQRIMVADLSESGAGQARPFVDTGALFPKAYPDGPVVDAEDHVWTGLYLGGSVARFSPDGELVATIPVPARDVTKMAFGGTDFATAYVTSATKDMQASDMEEYPLAGGLFAFAAPVRGFPLTRAKLG